MRDPMIALVVVSMACSTLNPLRYFPGVGRDPADAQATAEGFVSEYGFAALLTEDPEMPLIAVHESGEKLVAVSDPRGAGSSPVLQGVVFVSPSDEGLVVYLGEDGLPSKAVLGGDIYVFGDYAESSVEMGRIRPDGTVELLGRVDVDAGALDILRDAVRANERSGPVTISFTEDEFDWAGFLRVSAAAASVAGCAIGLAGAVPTGGVTLLACAGALSSVIQVYYADSIVPLGATSLAADAIGCGTVTPFSCAALVLDISSMVKDAADDEVAVRSSEIADLEEGLGRTTGGPPTDPSRAPIVFTSDSRESGTGVDIWTVDPLNPSELTQITNEPGHELRPVWSPNHARIAYTRFRTADNLMSLWVVNGDGTGDRQITEWWDRGVGSFHPYFWYEEPIGAERVYFIKDDGGGPCVLGWVHADGEPVQEEHIVVGMNNRCQPDLSADQSQIVTLPYGVGSPLEIGDLSDDGNAVMSFQTIVEPGLGAEYTGPSWSPDGSQIAFAIDQGAQRSAIYVVGAAGSKLREVLAMEDVSINSPAWSPDGRYIVVVLNYVRTDNPRTDLGYVDSGTGELFILTDDTVPDGAPDW